MPRPRKWRKVCCLPQNNEFGPLNKESIDQQHVEMTVDEYEAIRLIDWEDMNQQACAEQMNIARTTVQGIYGQARKKMADALINGKKLTIKGGDYRLCDQPQTGCGQGCQRRRQRRENRTGERCR